MYNMGESNSIKVAVIVEDQALLDYIVLLLVGEGYEVKSFSTQDDAIKNLDKEVVDLIISEFQSPNINGLDICKVLRKNFYYNLIPMFFLIPDSEPLNAARLIYAGADDYIKKSLIQDELFLKVKLNTYRMARQQDINNLTRLPGQSYLLRELQKMIESKKQFAISYLELYKFREFAYRYGFKKADSVAKYAASLIFKILKELGDPSDFLAHIQSNEFIFITLPGKVEGIVNRIIGEFDQGITSFYDEEDRKRGHILIKNRNGQVLRILFLKMRIGVVVSAYLSFFTPARIIQIASEVKDSVVISSNQSMYIKEEGKGYAL